MEVTLQMYVRNQRTSKAVKCEVQLAEYCVHVGVCHEQNKFKMVPSHATHGALYLFSIMYSILYSMHYLTLYFTAHLKWLYNTKLTYVQYLLLNTLTPSQEIQKIIIY